MGYSKSRPVGDDYAVGWGTVKQRAKSRKALPRAHRRDLGTTGRHPTGVADVNRVGQSVVGHPVARRSNRHE
jgi:hypothetical protein